MPVREKERAFPYLGVFAIDDAPSESSLGFFFVPGRGHFAHVWRESYGPFATKAEAIEKLEIICSQGNPGVYESFKQMRRSTFLMALGSAGLLVGFVVFVLLTWLAVSNRGGF